VLKYSFFKIQNAMKNTYNFLIVALIFCVFSVANAQLKVKRASLSSSVNNAHKIQTNGYKVQQSIGHMGITGSFKYLGHDVLNGFLIPQNTISAETIVPDFDLEIYPNPFIDHINISIQTAVSGEMVVRLYDITGQLVREHLSKAKKEQSIELSQLPQAQYLLSVKVMGKTFSYKLLNYKTPTTD
jgi:hypothetical protein